jgi:hypothetical protein
LILPILIGGCSGRTPLESDGEEADASVPVADAADTLVPDASYRDTLPDLGPASDAFWADVPSDPGPWPPVCARDESGAIVCNNGAIRIETGICHGHTFGGLPRQYLKHRGLSLRPPGACAGLERCGHFVVRVNGNQCNAPGKTYNCGLFVPEPGIPAVSCAGSFPATGSMMEYYFTPSVEFCSPTFNIMKFTLELELVADDGSSFVPPIVISRSCGYSIGT